MIQDTCNKRLQAPPPALSYYIRAQRVYILLVVLKADSCVKDTQVIAILYVVLLEIEAERVPFGEEVQRVHIVNVSGERADNA